MDPFTQRMLERAKIRREKLNSHLTKEIDNNPIVEPEESISEKKFFTSDAQNDVHIKGKTLRQEPSDTRKMKLQKLALFYAGKKDLSFEEHSKDDLDTEHSSSEAKSKCKLSRLAELASKINQWEDEIHCQRQVFTKSNKSDDSEYQKENEKPKMWNPMVKKLCSQGFSLSDNQTKLVYDFRKSNTNKNELIDSEKTQEKTNLDAINSPSCDKKSIKNKESKFPVKRGSPLSSKVAFFENGNQNEAKKQIKDPAELSLAERKAIFERDTANAFGVGNTRFTKPKSSPKLFSHHDKRTKDPKKESKNKPFEKPTISNDECIPEVSEKNHDIATIPKTAAGSYNQSKIESPKKSFEKESQERTVTPTKKNFVFEASEGAKDFNYDNEQREKIPESGRLYPSLSNLDVSDDSQLAYGESEVLNESKNNQLCLNMTLSDLLEMNKNNPITPPSDLSFSKSKEFQVLNKMDKLLEDALNDISSESDEENTETYPSPPKIMKSSSFEYKGNDFVNPPLLHTVSFYRKQQQQQKHSPPEESISQPEAVKNEQSLVENKIEALLAEVSKQQTIMSQASQALNLCLSTVEFSGSGEQVEGDRLLLLASHKRQACLNEIQRLKVERSLHPRGNNSHSERGDVTLTNISVKLKRDSLRAMAAAENLYYFVCLIKSDERVLATPVVSATRENLVDLYLKFPGSVKLESLLSNFRITVEVYSLELRKELLPHDVKYHIGMKKEKKLLTPIKGKKFDSKLVKGQVQSPAGPNAVRTSNFQICGYIVFSLKEVGRTQWMLNKVPYANSLEGTLSMTIISQLRLDEEFRGFLTMFDDISGLGAWHRRWCLLSSHLISFWKYPDDEQKKVPIGTIDLRSVITENVGVVPHDVCARLNTFLLETTRPKLNEDENSLVLKVQDNVTTIRHLLSADSKQEMLVWCKKLNVILALLKGWKCSVDG